MPWVIAGAILTAVMMGGSVLVFNRVVGTRILEKYPDFLILKQGQKVGRCTLTASNPS